MTGFCSLLVCILIVGRVSSFYTFSYFPFPNPAFKSQRISPFPATRSQEINLHYLLASFALINLIYTFLPRSYSLPKQLYWITIIYPLLPALSLLLLLRRSLSPLLFPTQIKEYHYLHANFNKNAVWGVGFTLKKFGSILFWLLFYFRIYLHFD